MVAERDIVVAIDTSNEVIAIGVGRLQPDTRTIVLLAQRRVRAHRASNTRLLPELDELLTEEDIRRERIACVVCGRGPGSFTGVRICMATAKGIASALEVALVGVSTSDAVAYGLHAAQVRGDTEVIADAMRGEVYPVPYRLSDAGVERLAVDTVGKADAVAERLGTAPSAGRVLAGDGLAKYAQTFADCGTFADEDLWTPQGAGLLAAAQAAWRSGDADPFDARRHDPAVLLPVYTRLSDAEENERKRQANEAARDLDTGVAGNADDIVLRPLDAGCIDAVARMEAANMAGDAWNAARLSDELPRKDRSWWVALCAGEPVGYAGGWVVDGRLQILKVAVDRSRRRSGIARSLLSHLAADARDLGAVEATLEVRASNTGAIAFYDSVGLHVVGTRPGYYGDGEDARIMSGPLPLAEDDVAGMHLQLDAASDGESATDAGGCILAIETSCDETAAAVIDADGRILADVVASQIDFHSRFGGVVPEIASRKHIEAICGVARVCLEQAGTRRGSVPLRYADLDAVAVTYTPGLVGALVVGVAFAKGVAWGADIPFIGVNHMEGHLYANLLAHDDLTPPMVVSLVSGGHTLLVHVRDWGDYRVLGSTLDDAVGEAFDKVAKALGLGYPGGPVISRLAAEGDGSAIDFPRAMLHSGDYSFSLSGLKTAVIAYIREREQAGEPLNLPDIAAGFEAAVVDVQVAKAMRAVDETGVREFCIGGGVAANPLLRTALEDACAKRGVRLSAPPLSACGDNAAMIALVARERFAQKRFFGLDADACAHADLEQAY